MSQTRPTPLGVARADATPPRFCLPDRPRCTCGERLRIAPVITDRIARCTHRPAAGQAAHDQELYLVRFEFAGELVLLVAPVTSAQVKAMRDVALSMAERLALLGLTVPNVDLDLRASA